MKMTKEEREASRARCIKAPEGPWEAREDCEDEWCVGDNSSPFGWGTYFEDQGEDFCKFVAHARTDLPRALDTIDHLEAENKKLRDALENILLFSTDDEGAYQHAQEVLGLRPKESK